MTIINVNMTSLWMQTRPTFWRFECCSMVRHLRKILWKSVQWFWGRKWNTKIYRSRSALLRLILHREAKIFWKLLLNILLSLLVALCSWLNPRFANVSINNSGLPNGRYSVIHLSDARYSIRLCVLRALQLLAMPHFGTDRCQVMREDQEGTVCF